MSNKFEEPVDSYRVVGNLLCIASELIDAGVVSDGKYRHCGSSDATSGYVSEYEDGTEKYSTYCFSCNQAFQQEQVAKSSLSIEFGLDAEGAIVEKRVLERKPKRERITREQIKEIMSHGYECELKHGENRGKPIRNIKEKYNKFFGHITKKDKNGNPIVRFYPETKEGRMQGYKSRTFPKSFGYENVGITGIKNDLSGQVKFKDMQFRDIVICAGEEDKVAFFQQFDEYQERRYKGSNNYAPMPVVSPNTGEGSAVKQLRAQYDFINRAERIFIGMDNDEVGRNAAIDIAEIFPKEKVFIISWSYKDPNNAINNKEGVDRSAQTIRDFYDARPYFKDTVKTSKDADEEIEAELMRPKLSLPPFMKNLQKMMAGGIPIGYIVNFIAGTGCGKTTLVNEAIRHWVFEGTYKIGILSLELSAAQYMISMLSREVGYKINLIESPQKAVEFVRKPEVVDARRNLKEDEFGKERFVLLDEREGDLEKVKRQIEILVNKHGCDIIVIDPLQDLFEGVSDKDQNAFVKWMKGILTKDVSFINVCHIRKSSNTVDANGKRIEKELSEDDVHGISAIVKSAGANIFATRNKYEEDPIRQNTTKASLGKCRWTGITGEVDKWYYHNESHTMYGLLDYFEENPDELPDGYDLSMPSKVVDTGTKRSNFGKKVDTLPDIMDGVEL